MAKRIIYKKDSTLGYYDGFSELENGKLRSIGLIEIMDFLRKATEKDIEVKIKTTAGNYTTYLSAIIV